jgi:hypothetical protein
MRRNDMSFWTFGRKIIISIAIIVFVLLTIIIVITGCSDETTHINGEIEKDTDAEYSETSADEHYDNADDGKNRAKAKFEKFVNRLYKIEQSKNLYDLDEELQTFFTESSDDKNMVNLPSDGETAYDWFSSDYKINRVVADQNDRKSVTIIAFLKLSETDHSEVYNTSIAICVDMIEENGEWLIDDIPVRTSFKILSSFNGESDFDMGEYKYSDDAPDSAKERFGEFLQLCYRIDKGANLIDIDKELLRFFSSDAYDKVHFITESNPYSSDALLSEYADFSFEYEIIRLLAEQNAEGNVTIAAVLKVTKKEIAAFDIIVVICVDMRFENGEWLIYDIPVHGEYGEDGDVQI